MGDIILSVNGKELAGSSSPHARLLELIQSEMRPLLFEFEKVIQLAPGFPLPSQGFEPR